MLGIFQAGRQLPSAQALATMAAMMAKAIATVASKMFRPSGCQRMASPRPSGCQPEKSATTIGNKHPSFHAARLLQ